MNVPQQMKSQGDVLKIVLNAIKEVTLDISIQFKFREKRLEIVMEK